MDKSGRKRFIFAIQKILRWNFRSSEISAKRNFASVDAKFRQDDSEIAFHSAGALTKFRGELSPHFRENKGRNSVNFAFIPMTFARYCSTVKGNVITY